MAGHSKWKNIQRTKGAADEKRGKVFTKIAREILVAVREGGSADPAKNSRLATAVAKAKSANMPNDNITRTIERALGSASGDGIEQVTYEGYGPRGVAVIIDAATDNRNRIASEVRLLFDKYGGKLGTSGCVSWSFDKKGVIVIDNSAGKTDEDTILNDALEAGADDIEIDDNIFIIFTAVDAFAAVSGALESLGYSITSAQIEMVPQNYITLKDVNEIASFEKMIDLMEDNDDINDVWHNATFASEE